MNHHEEGFTLIEVLISLLILGISVSILINVFVVTVESKERVTNMLFLSSWAESKLNEVIAEIDYNYHGNFQYLGKIYQWRVEEKYIDDNLIQLALIVVWQGKNNMKEYSIYRNVLNEQE